MCANAMEAATSNRHTCAKERGGKAYTKGDAPGVRAALCDRTGGDGGEATIAVIQMELVPLVLVPSVEARLPILLTYRATKEVGQDRAGAHQNVDVTVVVNVARRRFRPLARRNRSRRPLQLWRSPLLARWQPAPAPS